VLLHQEFIINAKKSGNKFAIIDRSLEKRITYSKALIASLILSKKIKKYKDGFIGVMIPNSAGSILTIIGIIMAGKVPVMINYSTGAAENCEYAQKKCGFRTIIVSRALLEKIGTRIVKGMVFIEDIMDSISTFEKLQAALTSKLPVNLLLMKIYKGEENDNAVILFTSGSEKDPKAVQITHKNLMSNMRSCLISFNLTQDDIMIGILPFFHVFGHNTNFWLPLIVGMTVVTYANPLDYKKICTIIREEKVTVMIATPVFFNGYLRQSEQGDFSSVRLAVTGADKIPDFLRNSYKEKHDIKLYEGYGTTETSPVISANTAESDRPGSVGKPIPDVRVKIIDIDSGKTLQAGGVGKVLVKGDLVMKGYFDDIEETSFRIKDGWYDTGDMGMLDQDGYLWHRGRLKRFVKVGGEMVSLVKVESVVYEMLPEEVDCCVVEVPDSIKGAKIVVAITKEVNKRQILKKLSKKLSNIEMPKQFILIDELPKMGSGKVDFRTVSNIVREKLRNNKKAKF